MLGLNNRTLASLVLQDIIPQYRPAAHMDEPEEDRCIDARSITLYFLANPGTDQVFDAAAAPVRQASPRKSAEKIRTLVRKVAQNMGKRGWQRKTATGWRKTDCEDPSWEEVQSSWYSPPTDLIREDSA